MESTPTVVEQQLRQLALDSLSAPRAEHVASDPGLARLVELGTDLWLDTGNLEEARGLWRREFSALTTNNTLANQVVQTGVLDDAAKAAVRALRASRPGLSEDEMVMEVGFVVNCHVALRLVRAFGARVSVELHPAVGEDLGRTVDYAVRYHAICPERFTIKIPLTPEGYCAVARVRKLGIPVNYTLGFSARQNYVAALVSGPSYVNVFLGRLNAVVKDNGLGDGEQVGEKATLATQRALCDLRAAGRTETRLIAASMREGSQVISLAGVDVHTMPPKAAQAFLEARPDPASLHSRVGDDPEVTLAHDAPAAAIADLWDVSPRVIAVAEELARRGGATLTGDDIRQADADHGAGLFHAFTPEERAEIREHGKIPRWARWQDSGIGLDDLMTQSALQSFTEDQDALDARLRGLVRESA